jgi:superfamily II DNA or RNA helicase
LLTLRPHQLEVVEKIREGFEQGHTRQLLYAPTGFGKTEVAMSIMKTIADDYQKTAMILDRVVLVDQTSIRLTKYGIEHGVMQSNHWRKRPDERIQICSAQTIEKRGEKLNIDLLIIDECHITRRGTVEFMKNNPHIKVVGLTATPFTKGLGDIYTHVVGATPTGDLIEKGWLVPLKVFIAKEIDMTGVIKQMGEWKADDVTRRGMAITGDIVGEWIKKTHEVFGGPRKTIVFCSGVEHGRDLVKQFADAGYNFVSISYKEDDQYKKDMIELFSQRDTEIHGLIATDILTRGFDVTDVMIGVSARPFSKSFSSHVQQLGRVMRPHEGKEFGLWLDHSGNFLRFREDWDKIYTEGVDKLQEGGLDRTRKEPTEKEKIQAKCPECKELWMSTTNVCHSCGHERQNLSLILSLPGELEELKEANRKLQIANTDFYAELLYYGRLKGYKEGWAAMKYKEKYGVYPNGLPANSKPTTVPTLKWIKSRMIAYSKGKIKTQQRMAA